MAGPPFPPPAILEENFFIEDGWGEGGWGGDLWKYRGGGRGSRAAPPQPSLRRIFSSRMAGPPFSPPAILEENFFIEDGWGEGGGGLGPLEVPPPYVGKFP